MSVNLASVIAEHHRNVGFVEGPNNTNPWGPEQGIANASYCDSAASIVPYHSGYRWWPESQCGEKGCAYCPFHINVGTAHGETSYDHASLGHPCDVLAGDLLFYDWNGNGQADHVETAIEDCPSGGRTHNIGYNTGSPEGCHDLWRDRTYLLCRVRPTHYREGGVVTPTPPAPPAPAPTPQPAPGRSPDGNPFTPLAVDGGLGPITKKALQWRLNVTEAYSHGPLVIDGDIGAKTISYLQQRLNWSNGPVSIDGQLGPKTIAALQRHVLAAVDGSWGPDTTTHLQRSLNGGGF